MDLRFAFKALTIGCLSLFLIGMIMISGVFGVAPTTFFYQFAGKWGTQGTGDGEFKYPRGIAVDSSTANVVVADDLNHRIQKFTSTGVFLIKWGSLGTNDGQFDEPFGVGMDSPGHLFVAEYGNDRIQKFRENTGGFIRKCSIVESVNCDFNNPLGIAADPSSGHVFVADTGNSRIQEFNTTFGFVKGWGSNGTGNGQFFAPSGVGIDSSGHVFVADTGNNRIQEFQLADSCPIGTQIVSGVCFVTKWGSYCNIATNTGCIDPDGSGPLQTGDGQFDYPFGVAIYPSGELVVADTGNSRIQAFSNTGVFLIKQGSYCDLALIFGCIDPDGSGPLQTGDGQFNLPYGIAVNPSNGKVYVSDFGNHRIQVFVVGCTGPAC